MQFATGTYLGDGLNPHVIATGKAWTPSLVVVKGVGATSAVFLTAQMVTDGVDALPFIQASNLASIIALGAGSFTVNAASNVNTLGTAYFWWAVFDDGAGDFAVGKYVGDAVSGRTVSLPFPPAMVGTKRSGNTSAGAFRITEHPANTSSLFSAAAEVTTGIRSLDAMGMTLGNGPNANASGSTYYYFAFKAVAGQFATGTYVGNGIDNRLIVAGLPPAFVTARITGTSGAALLRVPEEADGNSLFYSSIIEVPSRILRFVPTGFEVGTLAGINTDTLAEWWWALAQPTAAGIARLIDGKLNEGTLVGKGMVA